MIYLFIYVLSSTASGQFTESARVQTTAAIRQTQRQNKQKTKKN
jgi:hypothetical protein